MKVAIIGSGISGLAAALMQPLGEFVETHRFGAALNACSPTPRSNWAACMPPTHASRTRSTKYRQGAQCF
ncbi:MAG: hypothetical protein M9929_10940 [Burkholderiaceae bacterium]|nr:hypothetical protein [Burkholderiaceae bacterium]